jgi:hypothetical protein
MPAIPHAELQSLHACFAQKPNKWGEYIRRRLQAKKRLAPYTETNFPKMRRKKSH